MVILNSCTPLKARSYGLYLHFRGEKFYFKTVDAFLKFSKKKGFEPSTKQIIGVLKAYLRKIISDMPFLIYEIVPKVLKAVLSNITVGDPTGQIILASIFLIFRKMNCAECPVRSRT
ncbi:MAG: hypothetical protein K2I33_00355, partial [Oscillospiraceae bacterium]|nr:hypothetical protein [Oscillospiraceae bacterium]